VREIRDIVVRLGGEADAAYSLAGLGDLVTTATSAGSRHHELGRRLVRGERGLQGEGLHALQVIQARELLEADAFPLFRLIQHLRAEPGRARELFGMHLGHVRTRTTPLA
jgi:glycerol-3-phosphate dehydrogenase (NAD(P)+)